MKTLLIQNLTLIWNQMKPNRIVIKEYNKINILQNKINILQNKNKQ